VSFLWHFPARHRDFPLGSILPCGARTFLSGEAGAITRSAWDGLIVAKNGGIVKGEGEGKKKFLTVFYRMNRIKSDRRKAGRAGEKGFKILYIL